MAVLSRPSKWIHSTRFWVFVVAFSIFGFGVLASYPFTRGIIGHLSAGLGAGIAGALFWWVLIERPSKPTLLRGILFGVLTVVFSHPLILLIFMVFAEVGNFTLQFPGNSPSLSELYEFLIDLLLFTPTLVAISGIITLPIGIIAGLVFVALRRRVPPKSER